MDSFQRPEQRRRETKARNEDETQAQRRVRLVAKGAAPAHIHPPRAARAAGATHASTPPPALRAGPVFSAAPCSMYYRGVNLDFGFVLVCWRLVRVCAKPIPTPAMFFSSPQASSLWKRSSRSFLRGARGGPGYKQQAQVARKNVTVHTSRNSLASYLGTDLYDRSKLAHSPLKQCFFNYAATFLYIFVFCGFARF